MKYLLAAAMVMTGLFLTAGKGGAAGSLPEAVLPAPACAEGWVMDGRLAVYDRENLFERVNGESELYFPYGFERLVSARYGSNTDPRAGFDADVFRMGSTLDAFGIYANYRSREDAGVEIGAEGTLSDSHLFYYQDRYLVRLQATGPVMPGRPAFLACGRAIARNLPAGSGPPREIGMFALPGVVPKSERYVAESLLGYDFFRRGIMADLLPEGETRLFLVMEDSPGAAATALGHYRAYLTKAGREPRLTGQPDRVSLRGTDPLYGMVVAEQAGRFIVGAIRVTDETAVAGLLAQLRSRLTSGRESKP